MSEKRRRPFKFSMLAVLGFAGLAACGGGGGGGPPGGQPVADAQQPAIMMNVHAGAGPASWVLFQYDEQSQLYNVFINRNQLPMPSSGGRPDIGKVTSNPNDWESYARNTVTVLGTTTSLTLDNGSTPNTYTTT